MNSNTYEENKNPFGEDVWIPLDAFCLKYKFRRKLVSAAIEDGKLNGMTRVVHNVLCLEDRLASEALKEYKIDLKAQTADASEVGSVLSFEESKAKEKKFKALLQEIEYQERLGELVERKAVEKQYFELSRKIRNAVLNIPSKCIDKLAAETDPYEIEKILNHEIHECLEGLADDLE